MVLILSAGTQNAGGTWGIRRVAWPYLSQTRATGRAVLTHSVAGGGAGSVLILSGQTLGASQTLGVACACAGNTLVGPSTARRARLALDVAG